LYGVDEADVSDLVKQHERLGVDDFCVFLLGFGYLKLDRDMDIAGNTPGDQPADGFADCLRGVEGMVVRASPSLPRALWFSCSSLLYAAGSRSVAIRVRRNGFSSEVWIFG